MSFSLTQMLLVSAAYLLVLFGVAWVSEHGLIPRWIIRHPLTYTLSLGVYASAWAFMARLVWPISMATAFCPVIWGVRGLPPRAGAAFTRSSELPAPTSCHHWPICSPSVSQHLGRRADHRIHADRRAATAGLADSGGRRLHRHSDPRAGAGPGRSGILRTDHPVHDFLRLTAHRDP